jgi:hypothetical protein
MTSRSSSKRSSGGDGDDLEEDGQQRTDGGRGDNGLAETILADCWWQTAGLDWLDKVDVPENFVADGHLHMDV